MLVMFPLRRTQYPVVAVGLSAAVAAAGMLAVGLTLDQGMTIKLAGYALGLAVACGLWLYTDIHVIDQRSQRILRLAVAIDSGLGVQMNLAYLFWFLDLPAGSSRLYHPVVAQYFWLGPVVLLCAAVFYLAFKASINTEAYPM